MTLQEIVGSKNRVKVLRELFRQDGQSGREIARRAGISPSASKTSLEELVEAGLVLRVQDRMRLAHHLNRSHFLVGSLGRLFAAEARLPEDVADDVRRHLRTLGTEAQLLCLGINMDREVTLATTPLLDHAATPVAVLTRQLRSKYGLHLSGCVASPAAIPAAQQVWTLPHTAARRSRVSDGDRLRALRFFGISDPEGEKPDPRAPEEVD